MPIHSGSLNTLSVRVLGFSAASETKEVSLATALLRGLRSTVLGTTETGGKRVENVVVQLREVL